MCTFILELDTFSKCCPWRWRGGKRYCQHRAVIKWWRVRQESTRAGSRLMFFSRVPKKPGAALTPLNWQQPQMAAFGHACPNHSSHLLMRSCKVLHVCPVPPPCQPVILPILLWSHGSSSFRSLLLFFLCVYTHQDRRAKSKWLFKWMQIWTNVSFLSIKKNPTWFFRAL